MQEPKPVITYTRTLEDSLDFIDKAIDASDAEEKRRKAEEQRKAERSYVMMDSFPAFYIGEMEMRRERGRNRPPPYPVFDCWVCHGQDPMCPHRRNPNRR